MLLDYLKLLLFRRVQKGFKTRKTRLENFTVFYNYPRSLFSEFKNIFKNKSYHFESENPAPFIIDGGGHFGLSVLYFKKVYPKAKILVFEPDREILKLLKQNIAANKLTGVTVVESGLHSRDGMLAFNSDQTDGGKLSESGNELIKVEKLSGHINTEVDFLKLNIEGAELEVLKELDESGKINYIREMCLEWHSFPNQKQNLGQLLSILEKNKFRYLINHYDYKINKFIKPPFKIKNKMYYLLVYAKRENLFN